MSRTGTGGMFWRSDVQCAPPSNDTHKPELGAGVEQVRFFGSSRIDVRPAGLHRRQVAVEPRPRLAVVGRLEEVRRCSRCPDGDRRRRTRCRRRACDASTVGIHAFGARPGMFLTTFVHVLPPSRVTCTLPSSVPTQMTLGSTIDGAIVRIVQWNSAAVLSTTIGAARRLLLALVVGRQVGADDLPRLAVIDRLEHHVAAEIDRRAVAAEHDRRVPVEAVFVVLHRVADRADAVRVRRDGALGAAARVRDADHAALQVGVDAPRFLQVRVRRRIRRRRRP